MPRSPASSSPYLNGIGIGYPQPNGVAGPSYNGKRKSGLRSRGTQILALRFGWVVLVIWYEVGEFFSSLSSCRFPDAQLRATASSSKILQQAAPTHIVLIADPHIPHPRHSYPDGSWVWVNVLRQVMEELFMRKSWNVVMRLGKVDGVIVLGDMLDYGRGVMSDQEYEDYYSLFTSIFQLPEEIPMYYLPGNHDIPLGPSGPFSRFARDRYAKHFSEPNAILNIANHTMILLDAIGLVGEDYNRYASEMQFGEWDGAEGGVIEFIKGLEDNPPSGPKILLSHIPLARPERSSCGPLREYGRILKGAGPGYQNLLGSETSKFLLDVIKPSMVFSGDDHDYCDFTHPGGIREVTLKSFSSQTGIRRPGFQLLSLVPPNQNQRTIADRPCFLPDQGGVYWRVYIPLAIVTVLFLFGTNVRHAWNRWRRVTSGNHPFHGEGKTRHSPALVGSENHTPARRHSDRPSALSLPTRKSSQHLSGLTSLTPNTSHFSPRPVRLGSAWDPMSNSRSAPVSPTGSPRLGYVDEKREWEYWNRTMDRDDDAESVFAETATPDMSRRSSAIYMGGGCGPNGDLYQTPAVGHVVSEPNSYFLPLPDAQGLPSPMMPAGSGGVIRRTSSQMHLTTTASQQPSPSPTSYSFPHPSRRVTMPRLLSTSDWSAAAKAKEKSVLGVMMESLPLPGGGSRRNSISGTSVEAVKGFSRWVWKARNGVIARSWRETWMVVWPTAIVWVIVNALFFMG